MKNKKSKYSLFDNLLFIIKKTIKIDFKLFLMTVIQIPIIILLPLCATYLSRNVIMLLLNDASSTQLITVIVGFTIGLLVLHLAKNTLQAKINWGSFKNRFNYLNLCSEKIVSMDYESLENPNGQTKMQKALNSIYSLDSGMQKVFGQLVLICSSFIGLITYSYLILSISPWIVVILLLLSIGIYFINRINRNWVHKSKDKWVPLDRKLTYINTKLGDFKYAKDIRLYGMTGWLSSAFHNIFRERRAWSKKEQNRAFAVRGLSLLLTFIRDGLAYGILIYQVVFENMSAADFVFYFALIAQYAGWLFGMVDAYNALQATSLTTSDIRDFLELPDEFNRGEGPAVPKDACNIVFDHVNYCYPGNDKPTLSDICFEIKSGEKIAIVGLNGAGKSTLVKLLCGLYTPSSGNISIAGHSASDYNIYEYYSMLSVVFQDIYLMPVSVAKNIALCEENQIDNARLDEVLKQSGLYDKICSLPHKKNTLLLKSIFDDAVDFSGGELQKLALARALYKEGSILVLDEPTAALDPIAENEMYLKYNELTKDRTSIFISHRLSSTRFCDRILLLENGKITEIGTHDELMKLKGRYSELFEVQSKYYKEGAASNEAADS